MRRSAQRKRISGRKGFTLAELLVVVAIILILAGFGFVAVNRYQKRLKRVEMDNVAREIFVAAQNHLTASRAAGFWDGYVAQMEKNAPSGTDFGSALGKHASEGGAGQDTSDNETGAKENNQAKRAHDVYAANQDNRNAETTSGTPGASSDNVLKILLPYAAVDETLLTDGKYYVRYDAATASVLDVYYTDKDAIPDYADLSSNAKDVSYRTEYGVGWYGTAAITDTEAQSGLQAPVMAVRNAESLVVYIIDPNYKDFQSSVQLEIAQTGQDGEADKKSVVKKNLKLNSAGNGLNMGNDPLSSFVQVQHVTDKPITLADGSTAKDYMLYAVVLDSITRKNGHFSQLFPKLTAGADITVTATVSSEHASSDAKSSVTTNSLFEALNGEKALISNARHLENLSGDISALKAQVTTAEITDDLYWNGIRRTKKDDTKYAPYTGSAEAFIDAIRRADWKYGYRSLDPKVQGSDGSLATVRVYSFDGKQKTDARKFAGIETATLQKLSGNDHVLTGFDIVADFSGSTENAAPSGAGLFASTGSSFEINHLTVKNTRVYAAYTSESFSAQLSAGTIVGKANGSVTLKNVSAVTDCMRNGEIYKAGTYSLADGNSGLADGSASGSGSQDTSVPLVKNQISGVYSRDGIAGGLIGTIGTAGGRLEIENSFASVPVYSGATGNAGIAGGLVGKAAEGTITASFAGGYTMGSGSQGGSLSASSAGSGNSSAFSSAAGMTSGTSITSASNDYTSTTINVAAPDGIAGGLIGAVTGTLKTTETYATTSVSASVGGGFVGVVSDGNLELSKCYSTGRVFAKTEEKDHSGKFAGSIANNGSIKPSGILRAADTSKKIAEVKNGVLAGTASSNGETSKVWTFPENLIGGETDIKKSNPDTLQEIPAEDLAAVAGNHDFKAENQTKETGVLTYAYNSSLKGKDYPYPSYTKTSDNSSITQFAGYTATGKSNYSTSAPVHYGDWVVLRGNESKGVKLVNDAVLRADVVVPEGVDTVTYIIIGKTSGSVQQIAVKKTEQKTEQPNTDEIGKIQIKYLTAYKNTGADRYNSNLIEDSSKKSTGYQNTVHGAWANDPGQGTIISLFLDDLTTKGGQFADMCPVLIPGENISVVTVTDDQPLTLEEAKEYKKKYWNWTNQKEEEKNTHAETNSLFGSESTLEGGEGGKAGFYKLDSGNIQITNLRHLQNLEGAVSKFRDTLEPNENINYGGFHAQQKADIDAARFGNMVKWIKDPRHEARLYVDDPAEPDSDYSIWKWKYGEQDTSTAFGKDNFYGIDNQWLMSYEGGNHIISRIKEKANGERNGGLFATYYGKELENLTLDRFEIKSAGEAAGTLAGATANVNSLMITNVLSADLQAAKSESPAEVLSSVELTTQEGATADSYAGGLIGRYDAQNSTLKNCGAAVTVSGSASYAGGLVGGITNINTVQNCYAAGKTYESHYEDQDGNPIYNVTGVKAAGGLIGYAEGLNNTKNNYSTASVKATGSNGYAGGLIGQSNNADLTECYATGLVYAQDPNHAGLIAGTITGGNWENISYLPKINVADMPAVPGKNNTVTALTAEEAADSITYRYDKTLPETYPYPMYATAGSSDGKKSHYGDWPKPIPPKSLDAEVTNDEVLYTDLAPKKTGAGLPSAITVLVGGETSGNYEQFVIKLNSGKNSVASISRTGWKSRQVNSSDNNQKLQDQSIVSVTSEGKLRLILDDITGNGEHTFAKVCPSLLPGEDIKVVAFEDAQPLDQESLDSYSSVLDKAGQHNSLFADDSSIGSGSESGNNQQVVEPQANVAKNRHLQNLDAAVSGINSDSNGSDANAAALTVSAAVLDNDLDWATFASTVQGIKGETSASSEYTFRGIQDSKLTSFDGSGKAISNLTIRNGNQSEKNSGLFRTVSTNLAVSNLTLKNPSVQTTDSNANAGGLVGMHSSGTLTINNVSVLYDDNGSAAITASGSKGDAGGLVGMSSSSLSITDSVVAGKNMTVTSGDSASAGGLVGAHSAGTLTISNSAAAVYVQGGLTAGGVIGSADSAQGSTITNTYAGGHTVNGFYANSQDGAGRFNVRATAQAGNAGGLIGAAENGYISVDNTYSTASVSGATAGGLIGTAGANVAVQKSYATGLVDSSAQTAGAFIGNNKHLYPAGSSDGLPGNVYLRGVNLVTLGATGNGSQDQDDGTASSTVAQPASYSEMAIEAGSGTASPYDTKLGKNYAFRQAAAIRNIVHYGDWPTVDRMNTQYLVTFHYKDWTADAADQIIRRIAFADSATNVASVVTPDLASISGALEAHDAFMGWFASYDSSAEKVENYEFQNVTSDLTVYAHVETAVEFIQKDPANPDSTDKTVTRKSYFEKGMGNATLTLPKHNSFLSSGYKFDGWYLGKERLGTTGDQKQVTEELKTKLNQADYKVTARYTKLKTYEVRVRFIMKNEKQSDQDAITNGTGWTDDWVYTAPYGNPIKKENLSLPNEPNQYQATAVCKDDGTRLFPGSEPGTSGITASLSDDKTKLTFRVQGPKADEEESADSNVTIYVIYQANTAKYTVQHIFEDTQTGIIHNFDPVTMNAESLIKKSVYKKGETYTLEQVYPADTVGQMTKAQALTGDQLPEGFHQEGWIEQKPIAANGSTTIQIRYVRNTYTLSYDLNGGKSLSKDADGKNIVKQGYRTSEVYQYGQTVTLPDENEIIRSGYTLGSGPSDLWAVISKADYDSRSTADKPMIQDRDTLNGTSFTMPATDSYAIANWKENKYAGVSVEIWKQKTTDAINAAKKTYDYEKTVSISAEALKEKGLEVGTILTYDQLQRLSGEIPKDGDKGYEHFTYDSEAIDSPSVKADGSTVIKLYYNRNVITIQFDYLDYGDNEGITSQFVRVSPVTVYPLTVIVHGSRRNRWYSYSWGERFKIYPQHNIDFPRSDWEGNTWFGHFAFMYPYSQNNTITYYVPAEMYHSYSEDQLNMNFNKTIFTDTSIFKQYKVQFDVTSNDSWIWQRSNYILGGNHAYKVWKGLYQSNFADLNYVWPSNYQWRNGNTILTFLTKFEAPDEDSYSASDQNLIKLYADGTIDGDGNSSIENYLESSNSKRGKVENGRVKQKVTYGENSTDFEKADIIRMSGSGGSYTVSDKYLGYSIKCAERENMEGENKKEEVSSGTTVRYNKTLKLYYIRNSYKITFNNVGSVSAGVLETVHPDYQTVTSENGVYSISYLYKDAIEWLPSVVAPPSNDPEIDDDYVFLGWYDSAGDKAHQIMDGQGKITNDGKQYLGDNGSMPAHNIQLFAHWAAPERIVTVNLDPKKTGFGASPLKGVAVTYNNNTYIADQNGECTITIRKGDTLAGLTVDANTVKDHRVFKEWRIQLGQQSVRLDNTLGIYDNTEVDALWDRDDTVTYQMIAIDPTRPDGQNEIASWTSSLIPRGTEVTLDTAELQKMIPSGYVLQDGGDKAGEKKKIDSDGMVFRFYYKQPVGGWSYQIRQVIVYKDISHQNKTIEICHKILTRTTTDQQIVVNASDIFRQDSDAYDLDYMYAVSDEDGQTSKTQVTLTKPEKDGDIKTVTFKYTPDQELLDKMVSFTDQTLEYDGNIHEPVYTFKPNLYVKDAEDAADGSKEAALSKSVTYSYTDNQTGQTVSVEKGDIKTPETYTAAVEVKMTKGNTTITLLNKKRACLTIRPRVITIRSNDYDFQYNGGNYQIPSEQAGDQGYKQTGDFVGNDGLSLKVTFKNNGKPEQIGTIDNVISVSGLEHPEYYKVVLNYGKLTTTWPLTVRHVLLYGPDTTEDGKPIQQQQVSLSTEQMDHNTDKTVTVSPLNLNDTETHWYGLEVSKKSSENNNSWQVSYNSESKEYADGNTEVKYSRYDAENHIYTVYYELPMLRGITVVGGDGNMTFQDPSQREYAQDYESGNKKLYAGAKILVDTLNKAVSEQESSNPKLLTRTAYTYSLVRSDDGKKLSLKLFETVTTYKDTDKDGNLSEKEIKDQDQATDNASKPEVKVVPTELRSVTIDAQQTSSGGQEAPASSSP
ncbi:prepilin-type N-terminal cleavage/methylation domain-containing protein [Porcincola sp. LCP21S3_C12]|uniref:prepilin-type N-terminal cleavage/methylation domain-containing protein n=1 Tax=Porcincola sp. LCP21S3_C12 TaxID=3438798 RepID=UPI003F9AC752